MVRFVSDEDFNGHLLRAVKRHHPSVDILRAVDVGLAGMPDEAVLAWASGNGRMLLTHDRFTMISHVNQRLAAGEHTCGVVIVKRYSNIVICAEEISILAECSLDGEWSDQIIYIPMAGT